jgi:hypothetical protein
MQTQTLVILGALFVALFCLLIGAVLATLGVFAIRGALRAEPRWLRIPIAAILSVTLLDGLLLMSLLPAAETLAGGRPRDGRIVDGKYYVHLGVHEREISATLFHVLRHARFWATKSLLVLAVVNLPMIAYCWVRIGLRERASVRLHNQPMQRTGGNGIL